MTFHIGQPIDELNKEEPTVLRHGETLATEAISVISQLSTFLGKITGQGIAFFGSKAFSRFCWYGPEGEGGDLTWAVDLYFRNGEMYADYLAEPVALEQRLIGFLMMHGISAAFKELVDGSAMKPATTTGPGTLQ